MKPRTLLWLVATWLAFGSLFVVIKIGVGVMPPLLLAAVRFLAAGAILVLMGSRGASAQPDPVGPKQLAFSCIAGCALAFINGMVMLASTQMDSWIVSVLTCTIPLWCYLVSVLFVHRPLQGAEIVGMLAGFGGIVVILLPSHGEAVHISIAYSLLLLLGAFTWGATSVWEKNVPIPKRPLLAMGLQCLIGGGVLLIWSAFAGELHVNTATLMTPVALFAMVYLALVGSVLGYGAYMWLLDDSGPTIANSFGYVSPAIAVLLGWAILHEPITLRTFGGFALIVVAVVLIVAPHPLRKAQPIEHKIHR